MGYTPITMLYCKITRFEDFSYKYKTIDIVPYSIKKNVVQHE